jgi:uncharacterized CHY-type Zn-finger protein
MTRLNGAGPESTDSDSTDIRGLRLDPQTRCAHYYSPVDIVAIKMHCCALYYACKDCHIALADHPISVWPRAEFHQRAILCGACKRELTIHEYLQCASQCPRCRAAFNPACANHHHFYFETDPMFSG